MRRIFGLVAGIAIVAACGSEPVEPPAGKPKPDPYIAVRVAHDLDTTTKVGRANWVLYALLSGPNVNLNGAYPLSVLTMTSVRAGDRVRCMAISADSVGQRLIAPFAIGDTVDRPFQGAEATDSIAARWHAGNHASAAGYVILTMDPVDAWDSQQYAAGHGLVPSDPIKWAWTWTGTGATTFLERTANDGLQNCNQY
jgi:hypothetical protein